MAELEEEVLSEIELKPYPWWRHLLPWRHGKENLKEFTEQMNEKHPITKFTG